MQFIVTGLGPSGRSCVREVRDVLTGPPDSGSRLVDTLWRTTQRPFEMPAPHRRPGDPVYDVEVEDGWTRWLLVRFRPHHVTEFHQTDSIDYVTVLSGSMTLVLEDGEIEMHPGDTVVVPGVLHARHVGPEACVIGVVLLGVPAPEAR